MNPTERSALLNAILERAAEQLGDITPQVMKRYYAKLPEASTHFDYYGHDSHQRLEGDMVEQVLYCLMEWHDSPGEIEILLGSTIPHHLETLKVEPRAFSELIEAVCTIIRNTIPAENTGECAVWDALRSELLSLSERECAYSLEWRAKMAATR